MNLANILTILRLCSPFFFILVCLLVDSRFLENLYIFILFILMSITDYLDGLIARKYLTPYQIKFLFLLHYFTFYPMIIIYYFQPLLLYSENFLLVV